MINSDVLNNLLPQLHQLKRHEKLFLIQFLVSDLAQEEEQLLQPHMSYPIWTPLNTADAADTLMQSLEGNE